MNYLKKVLNVALISLECSTSDNCYYLDFDDNTIVYRYSGEKIPIGKFNELTNISVYKDSLILHFDNGKNISLNSEGPKGTEL